MSKNNPEQFTVTQNAMRPASNKRECFYCEQPVGASHKYGCVLISRRAKIRVTVEYEIDAPAHWGKSNVEFNRNDGSWCSSNIIEELKELDDKDGCLCSRVHVDCLGFIGAPFLKEK